MIAEGSVDRALCGKMYNRGVRMYKLVYETNMMKVFEQMDESYFNDVREITTKGPENMDWDLLWEEEKLTTLYNQYIDIMIKLKVEGTDLQAFWISFWRWLKSYSAPYLRYDRVNRNL